MITQQTTSQPWSPFTATRCHFRPSDAHIIDIVKPNGNGYWGGKSLESTRLEFGADVIEADFDWAIEQQQQAQKLPAKEITEEMWQRDLEVLPPAGWVRREGVETFHNSEMWSGNISDIYVRLRDRYFVMRDLITLTVEERVALCQALTSCPQA